MLSVARSESRRTIDVWIVLQVPEHLSRLAKDVTLSVHSQSISHDSRAARVPWTNAVRLTGTEEIFMVRVRVPANTPIYVHAVGLIEEPPQSPDALFRRRYIGFKNMALEGASSDTDLLMLITHFEAYTLYSSAFRRRAA